MNETPSMEEFWDAAARDVLQFQRCTECGYVRWPVSGVCPECLSREWEWRRSEGRGVVWSLVTYQHAYRSEYRPWVPYNVVLVELDEGVRLLSRAVEAGGVAVGQRVQMSFAAIDESGRHVPVVVADADATLDQRRD